MTNPERPSISERYASAIDSSHLEVLMKRCPVDYIVAAGWCTEGLGTQLMRLRSEYDTARGEHRQAIVNLRDAAHFAATLVRMAADQSEKARKESDPKKAKDIRSTAENTLANAKLSADASKRLAVTSRALIMVHLKTLAGAVESTHNYAQSQALLRGFMAGAKYRDQRERRRAVVARIASKVLDVWIDPGCPSCQARGFHGGYREPMHLCEDCGGSTLRIGGRHGERLASTDEGHDFGLALYDDLERKTAHVARMLKHYTSQRDWLDQGRREESRRVLQAKLVDLRSAQAQED